MKVFIFGAGALVGAEEASVGFAFASTVAYDREVITGRMRALEPRKRREVERRDAMVDGVKFRSIPTTCVFSSRPEPGIRTVGR